MAKDLSFRSLSSNRIQLGPDMRNIRIKNIINDDKKSPLTFIKYRC